MLMMDSVSVGFEPRDCLFDGVSFGNGLGRFQPAATKRGKPVTNRNFGGRLEGEASFRPL